jgi:hypothetical protein
MRLRWQRGTPAERRRPAERGAGRAAPLPLPREHCSQSGMTGAGDFCAFHDRKPPYANGWKRLPSMNLFQSPLACKEATISGLGAQTGCIAPSGVPTAVCCRLAGGKVDFPAQLLGDSRRSQPATLSSSSRSSMRPPFQYCSLGSISTLKISQTRCTDPPCSPLPTHSQSTQGQPQAAV